MATGTGQAEEGGPEAEHCVARDRRGLSVRARAHCAPAGDPRAGTQGLRGHRPHAELPRRLYQEEVC